MLKQSKLYLGRQIFLPAYMQMTLLEMTTFVKRKIPTLPIFFWLQSVVDVRSDCVFKKREWEQRKIAWKNTPNISSEREVT